MISVQNASKLYRIYDDPAGRLKEILLRGRRKYHRDFWAIEDVSLEVGTGEAVGIIGRNGAGKTTLLQIIAGVLQPTRGKVVV
ncbi:MAG TPA: ATP-binding cassette domain-containing protein, partial [Blastocatellia bacterium]